MATEITSHVLELPDGTARVRQIRGPAGAPTVILLHGLAATGRLNWSPSYSALAEHFQVICVDHRGHGRGVRTESFELEHCADDVVAVADRLGVERFIAVGYSMGGPIAVLTWRRHRERVSGLVLCATSYRFTQRAPMLAARALLPAAAELLRLMPESFHRVLLERSLTRVRHPEYRQRVQGELEGHDLRSIVQATAAIATFSARDWINEVDVPTAVVVTTEDDMVPPERQRRMATLISAAEVYEVEGDHIACVARADLFVPQLVRACRSVSERAESLPRSA